MTSITYVPFNPHTDLDLAHKVASLDRRIFAGNPWWEWKRCQDCPKYWGLCPMDLSELRRLQFRHCGIPIIDYWPQKQLVIDYQTGHTPRSVSWVALNRDKRVVGFIRESTMTPEELENKMRVRGLTELLHKLYGVFSEVAYLTSIGVMKKMRGSKIAKELGIRCLNDVLEHGLRLVVIRTRPQAITYAWSLRQGFTVIHEYHDEEQRVLMAKLF